MADLNRATRGTSKVGATLTALILVAMLLPGAALAAPLPDASVTPATGGGAISADTALESPGSGTYTSLIGPAVAEGGSGSAYGRDDRARPAQLALNSSPAAVLPSRAPAAAVTLDPVPVVVTTGTATLNLSGTSSATACTHHVLERTSAVRPTVGKPLQSGTIANTGSVVSGRELGNAAGSGRCACAVVLAGAQRHQTPRQTVRSRRSQSSWTGTSSRTSARVTPFRWRSRRAYGRSPAAALTCTTNPSHAQTRLGSRRFAGCKIDKSSPNAYTLRATSSPGGTSATSSAISITPGTPEQARVRRPDLPGAFRESRLKHSRRLSVLRTPTTTSSSQIRRA